MSFLLPSFLRSSSSSSRCVLGKNAREVFYSTGLGIFMSFRKKTARRYLFLFSKFLNARKNGVAVVAQVERTRRKKKSVEQTHDRGQLRVRTAKITKPPFLKTRNRVIPSFEKVRKFREPRSCNFLASETKTICQLCFVSRAIRFFLFFRLNIASRVSGEA